MARLEAELAMELAMRARAAADTLEFRTAALDVFRRAVPFDTAVFTEVANPRPVTIDVDVSALRLIEQCERDFPRYAADLARGFDAAARVGGFVDHDVYSFRDRCELPIYRDVVRPQGVRSQVVIVPRWKGRPLGMIRLERHGGSSYARDDLEHALGLLPTIELALAALRTPARPVDLEPLPQLSPCENEVARQVRRGLTTRQIALLLAKSPITVRNQIATIFDKTGTATRAELAAWVAVRDPEGNG